jgi:predicted DNA-binding protein (MmcQ/YjbR family)
VLVLYVPKKQDKPDDGILRISLIEKEVEFYKRISLKNQPEKRISLKNQPEKRISLKNQPEKRISLKNQPQKGFWTPLKFQTNSFLYFI